MSSFTKKARAAIGRSARRKGITFERAIAKRFRRWWPNAKRGLQPQGGGNAPDVDNVSRFWVECKAWSKRSYYPKLVAKAFDQACIDQRAAVRISLNLWWREVIVVWKVDFMPICVAGDPLAFSMMGIHTAGLESIYTPSGREIVAVQWEEFERAVDTVEKPQGAIAA